MQTLNAYTIPLESINLIEASAGTGKSWTVTYLYLRLILEKNLTVDQILVVTFTDAATKELRDVIRQRIVDALIAFEIEVHGEGYKDDDEYSKLISNSNDHEEAIRRLNRAKLSMDESAVFTIHSFCQRTLKENAFEASLPFESELISDDSEIMQKLTDDFWRRYTKEAPKALLFKLQQKSVTPDSLLNDVKYVVGKPYLEICGPESKEIKEEKWANLTLRFDRIIKQWAEEGGEVSQILLEDKNLNGNKFRKASVENVCEQMSKVNSLGDIQSDFIKGAEKFKQSYINVGIKAKCIAPEHNFFKSWELFSDLWEELNQSSDDFLNNTKIELIQYLQTELPKEKQRLGVLSFDDLLLQLQQALKSYPELAKDLRTKYQAALIDEFQDTDPIQYDIFRSIYDDPQTKSNAVFLVGDPKQAIYSFRGGDIYTYLKAKAETQSENQYTLDRNWRSHKDLINAFNTLYSISDNPFKDDGIAYTKVDAGSKTTDALVISDDSTNIRAALNFWKYDFDDPKISVATIRTDIANSIAGDIAQTLNNGLLDKAKIGDKKISGGDIAILVRSHNQADTIKTALNARGIPSVQNSRDSIYETHEANELVYLLKAIINPQQEDEVRRALVTEFLGNSADDLIAFQENNTAWEEQLHAMQNWHHIWKKQGFLSMMRSLMQSENTHQHLLSFADGERRISNVLQLSELIHQSAKNNMLGMAETLRWFQKQQLNSSSSETELRLESDDDLVKIVTIHKSKGLEYPIVYCPYIGLGSKPKTDKVFKFNKSGKACLEIGSKELDEHKALKKEEESAEDARLLYVALTRAKYQCNVPCFTQSINYSPDNSAFGWLLTNGLKVSDNKEEYFSKYQESLYKLAESNANINIELLPEYPTNLLFNNTVEDQKLSAREFTASIKQQAQITSFSGLTAGAHDEAPDYDSIADNKTRLNPIRDDEFPRGATAGTALHEIFEHIDFVTPINEQIDIVNSTLDKYGFESKHQAAALQLVQQSLEASLDSKQFSLKQLTKVQRLDEMEFYLPLARLQIDDLKQLLFQHLPKDSSEHEPKWQMIRDAVNGLYFEDVEGFLKGYIDLIFEHNGQYYLADYKSNSLNDYAEDALFEAMAHSHYYLQYLFYSVALHRYLKQRISDYHWDTHVGGVYYLFIRGMDASQNDTDGSKVSNEKWGGVFYDKPSLALIEALDNLFVYREVAC